MPDQVACFIELENGWSRRAALGARRFRRRAHFLRFERALAMNDPYMIARVRCDSDHTADYPMVRQRLGPHRIHFESWRLNSGRLYRGPLLEQGRSGSQSDKQRQEGPAKIVATLHTSSPPIGCTL